MKPNNPFLITGYYSPAYFCDRRKETEAILSALHNGRNITLIAPRRIGKTGLIRNTFYKLREHQSDIVTIYIDIYSTQNLGDFIRSFASAVLGTLDSAPQKALSRVSQFLKSCRPSFTFDELTGAPKVTIDIAPSSEEVTLKEIFDYLQSKCVKEIHAGEFIAEYKLKAASSVNTALKKLIDNELIYKSTAGYIVYDRFMAIWLRRLPF